MHPSALLATLQPGVQFDDSQHHACGELFVARHMSLPEAERRAVQAGVGLADRATEGWACLRGSQAAERLGEICTIDAATLPSGRGAAGHITVNGDAEPVPIDLFMDDGCMWLSTPRRRIPELMACISRRTDDVGGRIDDLTLAVQRLALVGPDAIRLLAALECEAAADMARGEHRVMDVVGDAVRLCRTDTAGLIRYDLIIDGQTFNAVLAVFCSWAQRLRLDLLPVGVDAVQAT